jgi:hypothetical protein
MRVMVIIKANKDSEAGVMPSQQLLTDMGNFNEELVKAGVMLAGEGLHPSSKGKRVRFSGGKRIVIDGPFAETKELIAGFWLWQVKSMKKRSSGLSAARLRSLTRMLRLRLRFVRYLSRSASVPSSLLKQGSRRRTSAPRSKSKIPKDKVMSDML